MATTQPKFPAPHPPTTRAVSCPGTSICPRSCRCEPGPAQAGRPKTPPNLYPAAPNKPNLREAKITINPCLKVAYSKIAPLPGREKQTQSNPIAAGVLIAADGVALSVVEWASRTDPALALSSSAPNEPNPSRPRTTLNLLFICTYRIIERRIGQENKPNQSQSVPAVPDGSGASQPTQSAPGSARFLLYSAAADG